jgi:hypothetical protein
MDVASLDVLPNETVCAILQDITDSTDMSSILNTTQRLRSLGQTCFTQILTSTEPVVGMDLILQLPKLTRVDIPILIHAPQDLRNLMTLPALSRVTILFGPEYDLNFNPEAPSTGFRTLVAYIKSMIQRYANDYYLDFQWYNTGHHILTSQREYFTTTIYPADWRIILVMNDLVGGFRHLGVSELQELVGFEVFPPSDPEHFFRNLETLTLSYSGSLLSTRRFFERTLEYAPKLREIRLPLPTQSGFPYSKINLLAKYLSWFYYTFDPAHPLEVCEVPFTLNSSISTFHVTVPRARHATVIIDTIPYEINNEGTIQQAMTIDVNEQIDSLDRIIQDMAPDATLRVITPASLYGQDLPEDPRVDYIFM